MEDKDRKLEKEDEKEKDKVVKETGKTIDKSLQCSVLIHFFFYRCFPRNYMCIHFLILTLHSFSIISLYACVACVHSSVASD